MDQSGLRWGGGGEAHSTARTQLQRIYDKVGVRSQAGLASALMAAAEPD